MFRKAVGGKFTGSSCLYGPKPNVNQSAQKSAGRKNYTLGAISKAGLIFNSHHTIAFNHQTFHHGLLQIQVKLALNNGFHQGMVSVFVILGSGRVNRRTFFGIQCSVLDGGLICDSGHFSADRINFLDKLTFGHSANGRAAWHGRNLIQINCQKQNRAAHSCCSQSRFTSGVSCPYNNNIVVFCIKNHW